ncbi:IS110 family transposase [Novosphingobium sp.]|jgi:transposase|uniref:IS110 family transposase n=1 Tax=Novosphingobium sp. TaxID=1874826 RepID=UPI002FE11F10
MTMEQEFASPASNTETVYAAIELSKKNWVISVAHPGQPKPSIYRLPGGDFDALVARLRKVAGSIARIVICYEAGYDGFWLARRLTRSGIECRVLDPASLQVNRRARRVKTVRIDALMLLRAVIAIDRGDHHVCAVVRVPDVEEEDARRSHRERQRLVHERTAHINRIKGLLFGQGIRGIEPKLRATRIDFASLVTAEGRALPERLLHELEREYSRLALVEEQIRCVEKERDVADAQDPAIEQKRQMLRLLPGVGGTTAAIMAREIFSRQFSSRSHLGSYLGLTPSAYDSGTTTKCQGISKAGNSWARRILIEIAWIWQHKHPASPLTKWFRVRTQGQSARMRRIMLVAMARKLAITLWRYVETGLVPEGLVMPTKAAATG